MKEGGFKEHELLKCCPFAPSFINANYFHLRRDTKFFLELADRFVKQKCLALNQIVVDLCSKKWFDYRVVVNAFTCVF